MRFEVRLKQEYYILTGERWSGLLLDTEGGEIKEWTSGTDAIAVLTDTIAERDRRNVKSTAGAVAKQETREEATTRFHKYWRESRPTSFLEVFLEGARVK